MDSRPSVVVIGSCMTDMVAYVPTLPRPGETLHGTKFSIGFGGKGANQAVMAAKRGSCTALVAKLGSDVFGDNYLENLRNVGVDVSHVSRVDGASGVALITVDDAAENCITIVGGANNHLSETDVMNCYSRDILTTARVLVMQMEVPLATNLAALKLTRQFGDGVTTIFNAAPATDSLPAELYGLVDIFCVNESEAEKLLGLESVRTVEEASVAASQLVNRGCRVGMVTLGPHGAVYQERGHDVTHLPSPKVQAVDTTGAGDAFIGALASLIADDTNNSSFRDKVEGACKVAAVSVTRHGTQSSFPGVEEEI